jgi:uncharacterized protein (DUF1778 family)
MPKITRKPKSTRFNIRTTPAVKQTFKRAAKRQKQTLSEFVIQAAEQRAAEILPAKKAA